MIDLTSRMVLSPAEAAEVLNLSLPTVYALIKRENDPIPTFRTGRKIGVPVSSLNSWVERQAEQQATA